ncbi:hypothetical protein FA15DRAFT_276827 [Coprinopsis marcescibilis]|uniref:RanBD1 domain-containing protein n=1 Tax=Coprinopsis marcescibilis TaxID=230819 RepID=A0A5C3L1B1_COPMA|nr:hypothetical protein FA15DRAFT_276827 [Coprinopsis marcescibilis]
MKRVADKQLIRDQDHDGPDDGEEPGEGFRKADESVLAGRKIRGLPKRVPGSAPTFSSPLPTPAPLSDPAPTPKFAGFGGFGGSSSFTFNPSANASSPAAPAAPSNTARTFASLIGSTNGTTSSNNKPASVVPTVEAPKAPAGAESKHAVDYYSSLRGLNVSLFSEIKKNLDEDPFFDLGQYMSLYQMLRADVQKKFDSASSSTEAEKAKAAPPSAPASFAGFGATSSTSSSSSEKPKASLPTPPSTFGGFGAASSSKTTTEPPKSIGGVSLPAAPTSFGGFGVKPAASAETTSASSGFSFGKPTASSGPIFGGGESKGSSTSSTVPLSFGSSSSAPTKDSNPFAPPSSSPFTFSKPTNPTDAPIPSLPFSFGGSSSTSTTTKEMPKNIFGSLAKVDDKKEEGKPASTFSFGGSAAPSFGTFGGSSSGFGFGSASSSASSAPAPDSGFKPAFSFGSSNPFSGSFSSPSITKKDEGGNDESQGSQDSNAAGGAEGTDGTSTPTSVFGTSAHDEEGEGEEDEETVHVVKSKIYRMKKAEEKGGVGWVEIGSGFLRIKKHKETDARRVLLRNSTTGKINLNFKIYSGLKPSQSKKTISFVGHDNGVAQTYSVRVGSEEQAKELKEALEREVEIVKSKEA